MKQRRQLKLFHVILGLLIMIAIGLTLIIKL